MKRTHLLLGLACLVSLGNSNCSKYTVKPDLETSALAAGDYTALVNTSAIDGCGTQTTPGYAYCRIREGQVADATIYFLAPPAQCLPKEAASCVHLEIYFPNGDANYSLDFPRGITRMAVKWKTLLKRDTFEKGDRGFWPFRYTINSVDPKGRAIMTVTEGEIRMRVVSKDYIALHEMPTDPNFVWQWIDSTTNQVIKMTTGGRTYASEPMPIPSTVVPAQVKP
jgi:hypothetical protein